MLFARRRAIKWQIARHIFRMSQPDENQLKAKADKSFSQLCEAEGDECQEFHDSIARLLCFRFFCLFFNSIAHTIRRRKMSSKKIDRIELFGGFFYRGPRFIALRLAITSPLHFTKNR